MVGTLRITVAPVVLLVLALASTPPTQKAGASASSSNTTEASPLSVIVPDSPAGLEDMPIGTPHVPGTVDAIVASGEWDFDAPEVTIEPPPPPPVRHYARRNYGPTPPLTGPILTTAAKYLGIYYVSGGSTPAGFDCSGFVKYVYAENGITIPRTVAGIRNIGSVTSNPQPGDIIVMAHHVALWVAPGWLIDSGKPGIPVQVRPIWTSAYVVIHVT